MCRPAGGEQQPDGWKDAEMPSETHALSIAQT
jgi:hypothetical protein